MLRLGISARCLERGQSAQEFARQTAEMGFSCIQLSLPETLTAIDTGYGKLSAGMARHIGDAFRERGVQIASIECYINPVHPDPEARRRQLELFKERIRYARDFGCGMVSTETGSLNADFSWHPDNHGEAAYELCVNGLRELVREAESFGVKLGIEGVTSFVANSPDKLARMIADIGSRHLHIVFDPANLLSADNIDSQAAMIRRSFELFGDRIELVHAKDFVLDEGLKRAVPPGTGAVDYDLLFGLLKESKPCMNVVLDHSGLPIEPEDMERLRNRYADAGSPAQLIER
ncbi:sugar phosphate isomerase/epimerase family protein [Cohnella sp. GCM10020058]|uniref:sugar phosphate isomerase/epimerase family protein n=1 Tax=Cohnella sp. GCM10020058 TaxID=3317330 RepID=UPI003630BAB5